MGALTSKVHAFRSRNWETKRWQFLDFFDCFGSEVFLDVYQGAVVKVTPFVKDFQFVWISDFVRFSYDFFSVQRLTKAYVLKLKKYVCINFSNIFFLLKSFFTPSFVNFFLWPKFFIVFDKFQELNTLFSFKFFLSSFNLLQKKNKSRFKNNIYFQDISILKNIDVFLNFCYDFRVYYPSIWLILSREKKKGSKFVSFSNAKDFKNINCLTTNINFYSIFEGKHAVCKYFFSKKNIKTICFLLPESAENFIYLKKNFIKKSFVLVNFFFYNWSYFKLNQNFLALNLSSKKNRNNKVNYLFSLGNASWRCSNFFFKIFYLGSHLLGFGLNADIIFPSSLLGEKKVLSYNALGNLKAYKTFSLKKNLKSSFFFFFVLGFFFKFFFFIRLTLFSFFYKKLEQSSKKFFFVSYEFIKLNKFKLKKTLFFLQKKFFLFIDKGFWFSSFDRSFLAVSSFLLLNTKKIFRHCF